MYRAITIDDLRCYPVGQPSPPRCGRLVFYTAGSRRPRLFKGLFPYYGSPLPNRGSGLFFSVDLTLLRIIDEQEGLATGLFPVPSLRNFEMGKTNPTRDDL